MATVVTALASIAPPAHAFLGPHQGEVFYLCYNKATTTVNGTLVNTYAPCNAPADNSAYWTPVLYRNGTAVVPHRFHVYLRNAVAATPHIFPTNTRWVAGNPKSTSAQVDWTNRYFWQCGDTKASTHYATPPSCPNALSGAGDTALTLIVRFPQCWDGSNWTYPVKGACPSGTTLTVQLQEHVQYMVDDAASAKMSLSTGSIYGVFAGFGAAWDSSVLQSYIDKCIEAGITCHVRKGGTIS
ncbi:MAG: DUF1996 domain-containing protein [Actinomycetota bacterium]